MKKRIALAAAIAFAISVGGMLPASAAKLTAPVVATSVCNRAGGTLELLAANEDITISLGVAATTLTVAYTSYSCGASLALAGLTEIVVKADDNTGSLDKGNVTIKLNVASDANNVANFGGIPMKIQADGVLMFDGSGLTYAYKPFFGTFTEEGFTIGSVTGTYYAGALAAKGSGGADVFDASAVTTTDVELHGEGGADTLKGGAGDDSLDGGVGNDVMYGNAGDDALTSHDSGTCPDSDKISPGKSPERCRSVSATGVDEAWGGLGDDAFYADAADTVAPGDGVDVFAIGASTTSAINQLNYSDSSTAINLNLTTLPVAVKSAAGDDYFGSATIAEFVGSEFDDTMLGNSAADNTHADAFYGGSGADVLKGFGGADFLSGNGGADSIKGGAGSDTIYGDTGADLINGGAANDTVYGGGGDDVMYGSAGDDLLRGEKGSDQAWGGKGTFDVCAAEVTDHCEFKK